MNLQHLFLSTALLFSTVSVFGQGSDDCEGWDLYVDFCYITSDCSTNTLHVGLTVTGTDYDDDLFYGFVQFDWEYLMGYTLLENGSNVFEFEGVPAEGEVLISQSTDQSPPYCSEFTTIFATGGTSNTGIVDNWAEIAAITNASSACGASDGAVEFYNPSIPGWELWYYDLFGLEPNPGGLQPEWLDNGNLVVSGLPPGDYCATFYEYDEYGCPFEDEECFTIGANEGGELNVEYALAQPMCDNSSGSTQDAGYLEVWFPESLETLSGFEATITDNETGESWPSDFFSTNDEISYGYFGWLTVGSYCCQISNTELGCSTTICLEVESTQPASTQYEITVVQPVDENNQNAIIIVDLEPEFNNGYSSFGFSDGESYSFGEPITGVWAGEHEIQHCGGSCCYTYTFEVASFVGIAGCTDPEACNYNEEAITNDGSCSYIPGCADLNGDGTTTIADLLLFLGEFGCNGVECIADFNQDGTVNINDLLILLQLL